MGPPRTADRDRVDALAQATLLSPGDCGLIKDFQDSLSAEAANGRDCGGLLTAILCHLGHFKERVRLDSPAGRHDQQAHSSVVLPPMPDVWGPVIAEAHASSRGGHKVSITGPGHDDRFQVSVSSPDDASRTVGVRISIASLVISELAFSDGWALRLNSSPGLMLQ